MNARLIQVYLKVLVLNVEQPAVSKSVCYGAFSMTKGIYDDGQLNENDAFYGITDEFDRREKQDAAVYIRTKQLRVIILLFCITIHHPFAYLRRD